MGLTCDPPSPLPGIIAKRNENRPAQKYVQNLHSILLLAKKEKKNPQCLSVAKWINKKFICISDFYKITNNNEEMQL